MNGSRARRIAAGVTLTLLIILTLAAAYAVSFGPGHYANLQSEQASGSQDFLIASASSGDPVVAITPAEGWIVQPLVQSIPVPILKDLPRPPLPKDPRVMLGIHHGTTVQSPDLALDVELSLVRDTEDPDGELSAAVQTVDDFRDNSAEAEAQGVGASGGAANPGEGEAGSAGAAGTKTELLASGHTIRYVDFGGAADDTQMLAFIALDSEGAAADEVLTGTLVRVEVRFDPPANDAEASFTDYLPALSSLLESVSNAA